MVGHLTLAIAEAIPAEGGLPFGIVDPRVPRHKGHAGGRLDDRAIPLDVLRRNARWYSVLVLAHHEVATKALPADSKVGHEPPAFCMLIDVPTRYARDFVHITTGVCPRSGTASSARCEGAETGGGGAAGCAAAKERRSSALLGAPRRRRTSAAPATKARTAAAPMPHARAGSAGGADAEISVARKAPTRASSRERPVVAHAETPQPSLCRRVPAGAE